MESTLHYEIRFKPHMKEEGFIKVTGRNVWYKIIGEEKELPLIILHGGPGYPHDYLEPLESIKVNRQVIFYDQLGCGNSIAKNDKSLWTVEYFVKELRTIINSLKIQKYHILGHSWGAALAVSFALSNPPGLKSLILADPYISTPYWDKDAKRLLKQLPHKMQQALVKGQTNSSEYQDAKKEYYFRHVNRFKEYPDSCLRSSSKMNRELYGYMWGPDEFEISGTLKEFDLVPQLENIHVPVLLLCGRFDEATPESLLIYQSMLSNAEIKVFENSAHMPHITEKEEYLKTVNEFLNSLT